MKRGQVSLFIIVAVVAVMAIAFIFFARGQVIDKLTKVTNVQQKLQLEMKLIEQEIERCVNEETNKAVKTIANHGGFFLPLRYRSYYGDRFAYLCTKTGEQTSCVNQVLSKEKIQERMDPYLKEQLTNCIDLSTFRANEYQVETGEMQVFTTINQQNILVELLFPVTISQDTFQQDREQYFKAVNYPFGEVLDIVNDITNDEASLGDFDILSYGIQKRPDYTFGIRKPHPDKLYFVKPENHAIEFRFAIQG